MEYNTRIYDPSNKEGLVLLTIKMSVLDWFVIKNSHKWVEFTSFLDEVQSTLNCEEKESFEEAEFENERKDIAFQES